MDDQTSLPHYPYRDDGMLLWNCIQKFVSDYLKLYYKSPADLSADQELQNWTQKLFLVFAQADEKGKDFSDRIDDLQKLVDIVTAIIFTCGPQHAAVNYPQYEYMAFVPNMPFAAYKPITEDLSIPEKSLMPFLPPPQQASGQLSVTYLLSSYRYDRLGYYEEPFEDPEAQLLIDKFKQDLNEAERKIELNNRSRLVEYNYLKPSLVPNSISI